MPKAQIYLHGTPARSWKQVAAYADGDAHDRSKIQVMAVIDKKVVFFDLFTEQDEES